MCGSGRRTLDRFPDETAQRGRETELKLGLLTAALGRMSLEQVAAWAPRAGYQALEVAAWPVGSEHIHQAAHLDAAGFTADDAARVRGLLDGHGLTISAVTYCGNNLHGDPAERDRVHRHLRACVNAAALLGVRYVTTFSGPCKACGSPRTPYDRSSSPRRALRSRPEVTPETGGSRRSRIGPTSQSRALGWSTNPTTPSAAGKTP